MYFRTPTSFVLSLALLTAWGSLSLAEPQTIIVPSEIKTAPAISPSDDSDFRKNILLKIAFEAMNPMLMGVSTFEGRSVCFIKHSGSLDQMMYSVNDVIGGFKLAAIDSQTVTFERDGKQFWLTLDQSAATPELAEEAGQLASPLLDPDKFDIADEDQPLKVASSKLKKVVRQAAVINKVETRVRERVSRRKVYPVSGTRFAFPTKGSINSPFGYRRHPMGGGSKMHHGVDIAAPHGTAVIASAAGTVQKAGRSIQLGRYVLISHDRGFSTLYAHLSRALVRTGERVRQGETVGQVGSTGQSTGPHLHFEIRNNGEPVNPQVYLRK